MATGLLPLISLILLTGVGAKILGDRYKLPSIIFLLLSGIMLGPSGIGIITQETFGTNLGSIVGFAVAIIVFEGAFSLKIGRIRESGSTTIRIVTIGAAIAFLGTSAAVHFILGTSWGLALLIGSLLVATGPTVITPILDVVSVPRKVETTMESEGIINDVTAAVMAIVVFKTVVLTNASAEAFLFEFLRRVGIGVLVGATVTLAVYYVVKFISSSKSAPQNTRLLVLVSAIVMYTIADFFAAESGVVAVATGGILLGNIGVPYEEDIEGFKGDVTPIVLSLTFIILAALVELGTIASLGLAGLGVVLLVIFVIRPLLVFVSSFRSDFSTAEKLFMSFVGPRGIIPAAVATLFAVKLGDKSSSFREKAASAATEHVGGSSTFQASEVCGQSGIGQEAMNLCSEAATFSTQSDILVSTVFLVIFTTVLLQGGPARYIAQGLNITPMKVIIIGGGTAGKELADKLRARDEDVVIIEMNEERVQELKAQGYPVVEGDGTSAEVLETAGAEDAKILAAMTKNDDANLLACQLANKEFGVENLLTRVNNPERVDTFEKLGVKTVATPSATATAVDNLIERPAITDWMDDLKDRGDVQDVVIESDEMDGLTVRELGERMPKETVITLITSDDDAVIPNADVEVSKGDRLTIMGERNAVIEAVEMFS